MPEHLRALVVILVLAGAVFLLARRSAAEYAMADEDFVRRRNLWFGVTLIAFLSHNFWIFLLVCGTVLFLASKREWNPMGLFLWLLLALPSFGAPVGGLGVINQLLVIDYTRLLSIAVLLPAALRLRSRSPSGGGALYRATDLCVLIYSIVQLGLRYEVDTATNTLRYAVYALLDVGLPYYVASRSLRDMASFRDAAISFVMAAMVVAVIGVFEYLRHWLLYSSLPDALGASGGVGGYLVRAGSLRAQATTGQSIAMGYVMALAIGVLLFLKRSILQQGMWWLGFVALCGGLVASLSRGPWLGAAVVVLIYLTAGPRGAANLFKVSVGVAVLVGLILATPFGASFVDHLPFVGTIEADNITYRQRLFEIGVLIVAQNPFFGSFDYLLRPEMQELKTGGMIDVVNSYLGVALSSGLVGLSLFVGAFVCSGAAVVSGLRQIRQTDSEERLLGNMLLACHVGIMLIIFTVSSITVIPTLYWTFIGLAVGYRAMIQSQETDVDAAAHDVAVHGVLSPRVGTPLR